jgi:enamine deaminase RidA (YjgF/YER057c/UK114 family)
MNPDPGRSGTAAASATISRIFRAREIGAACREVIGHDAAAMSAVQVVALVEDRAKVEIEATAVVP